MAALATSRTGRMTDIVATIQAEQDRIIRADAQGVLVVQGGPGTGKTAVALHRAAYLLYAQRERLRSSGVLVVGPNVTFLRYIEQVLPSLGETGVLLATPEELLPGHHRHGAGAAGVRRAEGRRADGRRARPGRLQHQEGADDRRGAAVRPLRAAPDAGAGALGPAQRDRHPPAAQPGPARASPGPCCASSPASSKAPTTTNRSICSASCWPRTSSARRSTRCGRCAPPSSCSPSSTPIPSCCGRLRPSSATPSARCCARPAGSGWTTSDIPLLDELAELLGDPAELARAAEERRRRASEREYAEGVLTIIGMSDEVSADMLADRFNSHVVDGTVAERAAADRTLGVRPSHRRRGAGAFGDDVAAAGPALPEQVDDGGRRRRPDRFGRRQRHLGAGARPVRRGPLAARRAVGQLPHARARSWTSPRTCWRRSRRTSSRRVRCATSASTRPPSSSTRTRIRPALAQLIRDAQPEQGTTAVLIPEGVAEHLRRRRRAAAARARRRRPGHRKSPDAAGGSGRQGPGVRRRHRGRSAGHSRRVSAGGQRPLRGAHPGHHSRRRRAPGRAAAGAFTPVAPATA